MNLGAIAGWASVVLGQLVSWPQVLKLRRERGDGVSLASSAIVNVSMTLFFVHAVVIGDTARRPERWASCSPATIVTPNEERDA
jgi:uncharacterized protein with PQ loop repeat